MKTIEDVTPPPNPAELYGSSKVDHVCYSLFFDERGNGPDSVPLGIENVEPLFDPKDGHTIVEPGMFLVAGRDDFGNLVSRRGGYRLLTADVRALRDKLSAWLAAHDADAPVLELGDIAEPEDTRG